MLGYECLDMGMSFNMSKLPSWLRILLFGGVTVLISILFIGLPRDVAIPMFLGVVILPVVGMFIYMTPRWYTLIAKPIHNATIWLIDKVNTIVSSLNLLNRSEPTPPNLTLKYWHLFEILFIILVAIFAIRHHFNGNPDMRVRGREVEWLTGYAQVARQGLEDTGTIPLWNPYYRQGEPLIDNAFSFILNPFSSLPNIIWGSTQGVKYSITLHAGLVALGGWFLAWTLGLSWVGRLTLAVLLLSKGNMHANFDAGYYQLATQQVYFPWVIAGAIALIKTRKRWAVVLTALSLTLMFFAGNLWHLLPSVISFGVLIVVYLWLDGRLQYDLIRRVLLTTIVTIGLCAVLLLSIVSNFGLIEDHPDELQAGWAMVDRHQAFLLPFVGDYDYASVDLSFWVGERTNIHKKSLSRLSHEDGLHFFYSYVTPLWYVILIILPLPFMRVYRHQLPDHRRLWWAGGFLYLFFTMWGMGGTPLFLWLYEHVPYLGQWRFVPRAFAMASFWIAVLVTLRTDALWRLLLFRWMNSRLDIPNRTLYRRYAGLTILFVGLTLVAWFDVTDKWQDSPLVVTFDDIDSCLTWLNEIETDTELSLWVHGYSQMTQFVEHDVRVVNIEADYLPGTAPNTLGDAYIDARERYTRLRFRSRIDQVKWFNDDGYQPLIASPSFHQFDDCIYENNDYDLPYAFTFDIDRLDKIQLSDTTPNPSRVNVYLDALNVRSANHFVRLYDTIGIQVLSDETSQKVLVIQELAFPGWEVWIDGEPHPIEIFAKLNAVKLPMVGRVHDVMFLYRPPLVYWGGLVTLITAFFCIGYLLKE